MIQAIFFDIDGTLIDTSTHIIPSSTIKAIQLLRQNGYKVAIASGRDIKNMQAIQGLDVSLFDGFVASNGMCIFAKNLTCIHKHSYQTRDVEQLLQYANEHQITLVFETMEDIYIANEENRYVDIANEYYHEITPPHKIWNDEEVVKISCFQELQYDFQRCLKGTQMQAIPSPTTTYDVIIQGVSKLTGIHELMRDWNFDIHNFMCFGDHENDIEMIQGASLGIAVKDPLGSSKLQALADDTCDRAGNDGIYTYLHTHGYI